MAGTSPAMTTERGAQDHLPATRSASELCHQQVPRKKEGAGNAGRADRTHSLACEWKKHTSLSHHRSSRITRHSLRDGFTVSFALSPETWLCCLRRRRDAKHPRQLDTCLGVSGPHDFAVRAQHRSSVDVPRPSHPAPNTRDDREAPLFFGHGTARACRDDLPDKQSEIFFREGLDMNLREMPVGQISRVFATSDG
jgi:hypothetical protein